MIGALLKFALSALIACALVACLAVFEASSATAIALRLAADARQTQSDFVRNALLDRAELTLKRAWSAPLTWHAGAAEALSAISYMRAELGGGEANFAASVHYGARAVLLAPVQPHAWIRLAALAERGYENDVCDLEVCLDRAWASAPLLDAEVSCARLQIGARAGLIRPDNVRVSDYLRSGVSRRAAAQCLSSVFPADTVFQLAMRAQAPN